MTITPDQARELLDGATPGPWFVHTDPGDVDGTYIHDDLGHMCVAIEHVGSDYRHVDLPLAAAAPDMATTIAGMTEEWGVERRYRSGTETATVWFPTESDARREVNNPNRQNGNPRLVRRLVSAPEVIDGE